MRDTRIIKAAKLGYITLSALFCLLGITMIFQPTCLPGLIARLVGIMLIIFGVIRIVGFYSKDLYRLAFQHDLALGILTSALGLMILLKPDWALNIVCLILGIGTITDGLFKVQTALDARRFGLKTWWLILTLAVVAGLAGIWMIASPIESGKMLVQLLGALLFADGVLNLCVAVCAIKIIAHQQPDVIEKRVFQ